LKFKVALEAIRGEKQLAQIAEEYHVHPQQVTQWKKELLEKGPELFATQVERDGKRIDAEREELYKTIGHQQVVISWFKKEYRSKQEGRIDLQKESCAPAANSVMWLLSAAALCTAMLTMGCYGATASPPSSGGTSVSGQIVTSAGTLLARSARGLGASQYQITVCDILQDGTPGPCQTVAVLPLMTITLEPGTDIIDTLTVSMSFGTALDATTISWDLT
jgi:transposase